MDHQLSDDQELIRSTVRAIVERHGGARLAYGPGAGAELWGALTDAGFVAALVDDAGSGAGTSLVGAWQELGRVAAPVPYFETGAFAAGLLPLLSDGDLAAGLADAIRTGASVTAQLSSPEPTVSLDEAEALHGRLTTVPYAGAADHAAALARRRDSSVAVVLVPLRASGADVRAVHASDFTVPVADVVLDGAACHVLDGVDPARGRAAYLCHLAVAVSCASAAGAAQALDLAVEHTTNRVQFDVPLVTFQAVRHRLADMKVAVDMATAVSLRALWSWATGHPARLVEVAAARAFTSEAFVATAESAVQLHGAMGFTWEVPVNMLLKRSIVWAQYPLPVRDLHQRIHDLTAERPVVDALLGGAR